MVNDAHDGYQEAVEKGRIMQILLQKWWGAENESRDPIDLKAAMGLKVEIERAGFPVDWSVHTFYSWMDSEDGTASVGVFVRRPPKDGTPTQKKIYDDWFRKIHGISNDEFPHDPQDDPDKK